MSCDCENSNLCSNTFLLTLPVFSGEIDWKSWFSQLWKSVGIYQFSNTLLLYVSTSFKLQFLDIQLGHLRLRPAFEMKQQNNGTHIFVPLVIIIIVLTLNLLSLLIPLLPSLHCFKHLHLISETPKTFNVIISDYHLNLWSQMYGFCI